MNNHRINMNKIKVPKRYAKQYNIDSYLKSFLSELRISLC